MVTTIPEQNFKLPRKNAAQKRRHLEFCIYSFRTQPLFFQIQLSFSHAVQRVVAFVVKSRQCMFQSLKNQIGEKKKKKRNTAPQDPQDASANIRALFAHVYCTSNDDKRQQYFFLFL